MEYMSTEIRSAREVMTIFKILGIKDISTDRQQKNGTQVFELPIQQMYQNLKPYNLKFATYRTANKDREWNNPSGDDIKVIINGHRYNLS